MRTLLLALVVIVSAGCGSPSAKLTAPTKGLLRARDATVCDPPCAPGLACADDGECGEGCGLSCATEDPASCVPGSVVCVGGSVCALGNDCINPCRVAGDVRVVPVPGDCKAYGLWPLVGGACVVPCWYPFCAALGGSC